jgi:hypothetical protein
VPGGRWTSALAIAVVVAGLAGLWVLRSNPAPTTGSNESPAASIGPSSSNAGPAASAIDVAPTPIDPAPTPLAPTAEATPAEPSIAAPATAVPHSTSGAPTVDPDGDPGPTDAPHETWHPPTVFSATVWFERRCANGTEYDMVYIDWSSPTPVDDVYLYLNGEFKGITWFASGGQLVYENRHGASQALDAGTTYVPSATFIDADNNVIAGPIEGPPYTPVTPPGSC